MNFENVALEVCGPIQLNILQILLNVEVDLLSDGINVLYISISPKNYVRTNTLDLQFQSWVFPE